MVSAAATDIEAINRVIAEYGARHKAFVLGERREGLRSSLFDVARRSIVGWEVVHDHAAWLLREITEATSPEEIGRRMKRVGARPYYLQIAMLLCGCLSTRQLRIHELDLGPDHPFEEERLDDLALVCDFCVRVARTLREDDLAFPAVGGGPHPILEEGSVESVEALMVDAGEVDMARIRRLAAMASMYAFLLHGEQRDGITGHGPYPGAEGSSLFLVEVNDLRNGHLPWAPAEPPVPFDCLAIAYEAEEVEIRYDVFGALVVEPLDFFDRVRRVAPLGSRGSELTRLDDRELERAQAGLEEAQQRLYEDVVAWPDRMRIEYGAPLFGNHLETWIDVAGADPALSDRLREAVAGTGARAVDRLLARGDVPNLYAHLHEPGRPLFSPVVAG